MKDKIKYIKNWLGNGSINIFGLPMSGKDTVGVRLAEDLGAEFLSSGDIIREAERSNEQDFTSGGILTPTKIFFDLVLPYFGKENLKNKALVLSSIGRWTGEEIEVIKATDAAGHAIKVVIFLDMAAEGLTERWCEAQRLNDRGDRSDDKDFEVFKVRLKEFEEKTLPVLKTYEAMGLLEKVDAEKSRAEVYEEVIERIYQRAKTKI